jgi:hypothetical protein
MRVRCGRRLNWQQDSKMVLFEKKNQKTFAWLSRASRRQPSKSLFASFSSEKEDSSYLRAA